jgi:hypothetical protein
MKIIAKNTAIGQSAEDIISKGGILVLPTQARIHALVSNSTADDAGGTQQVETATALGTIAGINQVETATIVGTIGVAGAGNAKITITSALVTGSPLDVSVAVANDDTANQVATKVRAALNATAAVTTHYTIGGSNADVSLTTKLKLANDGTLNIASTNDTCTGLTPAPTSVNTTAGHAGSGNAAVIVTSALVTGSPLTSNVPVIVGDTASQWAEKVRAHLNAVPAITAHFDVSGATDKVILTAKLGAANDATLNISLDNGTCNGITTAATSADTTAGIAGTGAHTVEVKGVTDKYLLESETVSLNGTTPVNTAKKYLWLKLKVKTASTGGKNAGTITATAATDGTVTCQIEADKNISEQAIVMMPKEVTGRMKFLSIATANVTGGAVTSVSLMTKKDGEVWVPEITIDLDSTTPTFRDFDSGVIPEFAPGTIVKFQAIASAGSSSVSVNFDMN